MIEIKNKIEKKIHLKLHNYLASIMNRKGIINKEDVINLAINLASSFYIEFGEEKENSSDYAITIFRIIDDFYRKKLSNLYTDDDSTDLLHKYQIKIREEKPERNKQIENYLNSIIENYNQKSIINLFIDEGNLNIQLNNDIETNQPALYMNYLGIKALQTIGINELIIDLKNLTPKTFRDTYFYSNDYAFSVMYYKIEEVIELHINKYNRLLQSDLVTYIVEAVLIISTYQEQILRKSFDDENKKLLFLQYYSDFKNKI